MKKDNLFTYVFTFIAIAMFLFGFIIGEIKQKANNVQYEYGMDIINDTLVTIHSTYGDRYYETHMKDIESVLIKDNL
jgi:transposase